MCIYIYTRAVPHISMCGLPALTFVDLTWACYDATFVYRIRFCFCFRIRLRLLLTPIVSAFARIHLPSPNPAKIPLPSSNPARVRPHQLDSSPDSVPRLESGSDPAPQVKPRSDPAPQLGSSLAASAWEQPGASFG